MSKFDLIVIGSGPGGYKAAITAAHLGARVALVEKGLPGGTCLNQGCIPKKTLIHLALLIEDVNDLQGRGLAGKVSGDFPGAMAHKNAVVAGIRDNFSVWLNRLGVKVFHGEAKLLPGLEVQVTASGMAGDCAGEPDRISGEKTPDSVKLIGDKIIIATGAVPRELENCPTDGSRILNSRDFMFKLNQVPESVLCVGGGAIGVELGFLMHQFGARVCIIEKGARLLDQPQISERASNLLERKFKRIGIDVKKHVSVTACRHVSAGVEVSFSDGKRETYHKVLIAVGRRPASTGLGLEQAGVKVDAEGFIEVTEYLETSVQGIYAIGDVKEGPMTANGALHDAKVAVSNAINGNVFHPNYHKVPVVINSAFEIAAVGLTEDQADAAGFTADVARASFGGSGKARAHHDFEGFIEVVHDGESGQLLGGCIVGPEAGEQIHMMTAACQSERGLWFFKDLSYSHPSWCEELETAIDPYTSAYSRAHSDSVPGIYATQTKRKK
ncbi:MAG: NAD(P)/FAD-dependent oxidoreductase [Sulfurimicrobium sp.]|nr:NAD(P)/FAD-dependent oxidoreductase [Sulfurimicrobium sp.]